MKCFSGFVILGRECRFEEWYGGSGEGFDEFSGDGFENGGSGSDEAFCQLENGGDDHPHGSYSLGKSMSIHFRFC